MVQQPVFAETTSMEVIALDEVRYAVVRQGYEYWDRLRGKRRFPARDDLRPRAITSLLPNMVLAQVLDGGKDFHLKIAGDEVSRAYRAPLNNRRMSEIAAELPNTVERWLDIYRRVVQTGAPLIVRAIVGLEAPEINFTRAETICLPLGATDDVVDHVMTFGKRTSGAIWTEA